MPRASRPARAVKHGSMSNGKRLAMRGNNKFGSKGCMKCEECRRRKTKCDFDPRKPNEPCRDCKRRGFECGKALPTQTGPYYTGRDIGVTPEFSNSSSPSSPSEDLSPATEPHVCDTVKVELEPKPLANEVPASTIFEKITTCVRQIEVEYPSLSPMQVFERIRNAMENGRFGDLCVLLNPHTATPSVTASHTPVAANPQLCSSMAYPMYTAQMPYIQQSTVTVTHAETIDPMTLRVPVEDSANMLIDLDSAFPDDYDMVMPYNLMGFSGIMSSLPPRLVEAREIYGYSGY